MKFALTKNGQWKHISSAERGLSCSLLCAVCGEAVIAKKGAEREHHFSHAADTSNCVTRRETLLHLCGKSILLEHKGLMVPPIDDGKPSRFLQFIELEAEVRLEGFKPDLLGITDVGQVAIEIGYSSFPDIEKRITVSNSGIRTLEIGLDHFDPENFDVEELTNFLISGLAKKTWLSLVEVNEQLPLPEFENADDREDNESKWSWKEMILYGCRVAVRQFKSGWIYIQSHGANSVLISALWKLRRSCKGSLWVPSYRSSNFPPKYRDRVWAELHIMEQDASES